MDVEAFWKRVKELIKERKTKQEELAVNCGISYRTFQTWINRKTYPDAAQAFRIASALGTTVEYLVTGKIGDKAEVIDLLEQAIAKITSF